MITAGAIVVASFFTVSAITQLTMAANQSSPKGHSADDRISFWFKACACGLFGGNGLVWVLDAADQIECRAANMEAVTSTVAILSALAFVAALQRFFLSTAMLSASASIILIAAHGRLFDNICGSISVMLGSAAILFTGIRTFTLLHPAAGMPDFMDAY